MSEPPDKVITFPPKFYDFVDAAMAEEKKHRHLVIHGGRASGKTTSCAMLLLFMGTIKPLRILCAREVMSSIDQSVHQVLRDCIRRMGLENFYRVEKHAIYGSNDPDENFCTTIKYSGLKTNIDSVRSMEGLDIVWLEECHDISRSSLRTLLPTIRKMGSQIWYTYNPRFANDEIHRRFVLDKDDGDSALVLKMDYCDNPFIENTALIPDIMRMKEQNYEEFLHVYMGATLSVTEGAVLAKEIKEAESRGRFTKVPYDPAAPVIAAWDMGIDDSMVVILAQRVPGGEIHLLDCIEGSQEQVAFYLDEIRKREIDGQFRVARHYLPHDARARSYVSGLTAEETIRNAGNVVQIVPRVSEADGIQAVRALFKNFFFDDQKCGELIANLRLYRYEVVNKTIDGVQRLRPHPVHDHSSHFFDALKYLSLSLTPPAPAPKVAIGLPKPGLMIAGRGNSWMANF